MKITQTSSFWVLVISLILSLIIGQIHWILGVVFFFVFAGRCLGVTIFLDAADRMLEYHHDRNDQRAKKEIASMMLVKAQQAGIKLKRIN